MRRIAPRLLAAGLLAILVAAVAVRGSAKSADPQVVTLAVGSEERVYVSELERPGPGQQPRQMLGYWGALSGADQGTYRATCISLGVPRTADGTQLLDCSVLLWLRDGTVAVHGLVEAPPDAQKDRLFGRNLEGRQMAVTGGTGRYAAGTGYLQLIEDALQVTVRVTG
jgi:hypothetical protein